MNRNARDNLINSINNIIQKYNNSSFDEAVLSINNFKNNFKINVLFVGNFNAGKTALINSLLKRSNFLVEEQKPQTTLATELYYTAQAESFYAIKAAGGEKTEVDIYEELDASEYSKAKFYLNSDILMKLSDYVIVDTPGYGSGIESHNRALMNYLSYGTAYIFVKNIQINGGLSSEDISFMNEISTYSGSIAVVLNKCDTIAKSKIAEIKSNVEEQLNFNGFDIPVYCISKYDEDSQNKLFDIINDFDTQKIFTKRLDDEIKATAYNLKNTLGIMLNTSKSDEFEHSEELYRMEEALKSVSQNFENKRQQAYNDLIGNGVDNLIDRIKDAMYDCEEQIISAVESGGNSETISAIIASAIRPVMIKEVKNTLYNQTDNILSDINTFDIAGAEDPNGVKDILLNINANTKRMIDNGTLMSAAEGLDKMSSAMSKAADKTSKAKKIYKGAAGVAAIVTDFIAPWAELIIVFLPDIIELGKYIFAESKSEKIRRMVENDLYPRILLKMSAAAEDIMQENYNALMEIIECDYNNQADMLRSEIDNFRQKQSTSKSEYEAYISNIKNDIAGIEKIIGLLGR